MGEDPLQLDKIMSLIKLRIEAVNSLNNWKGKGKPKNWSKSNSDNVYSQEKGGDEGGEGVVAEGDRSGDEGGREAEEEVKKGGDV